MKRGFNEGGNQSESFYPYNLSHAFIELPNSTNTILTTASMGENPKQEGWVGFDSKMFVYVCHSWEMSWGVIEIGTMID